MAERKPRKTRRHPAPRPLREPAGAAGPTPLRLVEIPGELAREMRPDLWDPTDPGFRIKRIDAA